jgi:beta-galactosidase beta subunit
MFYEGGTSFVRVEEGMFTIFFPDDLHMPLRTQAKVQELKVVVKVLI